MYTVPVHLEKNISWLACLCVCVGKSHSGHADWVMITASVMKELRDSYSLS